MFEQRQLGLDLHGYLRAILLLGCTVSIVSFQWNLTPNDKRQIAVEGSDIRMYWSWSRAYNERKSLNTFRKGSTDILKRIYNNNVYATEITLLHGQKYKLDVADGDQFGIWILNLTKEDDVEYCLGVWANIALQSDLEYKNENRFAAYYSREELGVDLMFGGIELRLVPSKPAVNRTSSVYNEWTAHNGAIQATNVSFGMTAPMKTVGMRLTGQEGQRFTKRNTTSLVGELKVEPGTSYIIEVAVDYGFFYFTGLVTLKVDDTSVTLVIGSVELQLEPSEPAVKKKSLNNEWTSNTEIYPRTVSVNLIAPYMANMKVNTRKLEVCSVTDATTCSGQLAVEPVSPLKLEVDVDYGAYRFQGTVRIAVEGGVKESNTDDSGSNADDSGSNPSRQTLSTGAFVGIVIACIIFLYHKI